MSSKASNNGGCLFAIINVLLGRGKAEPSLPYCVRDDFLSPAESSFYRVLLLACGEHYRVFPKVNLADILFVKKGVEKRQSHRNRISTRHADFLLCNAQTLRPALAIELDDSSHNRADRKERDAFVDQVFKAAGLPLLHVPAKNTYEVKALRAQIAEHLAQRPAPIPEKARSANGDIKAPTCPKCGIPMVIRTSTKTNQTFFGCPNYPQCREMRSVW